MWSPPVNEIDPRGVRAVAWSRALIAVAAATICAFLPATFPNRSALQVVTGLLWVPWAGVLCLLAEGKRVRFVRLAGAGGDLMVVFVLQWMAPGLGALIVAGYALAVISAAYMADRRSRVLIAVAALALAFLGFTLQPATALALHDLAAFALLVVAVTLLLDRAATSQERHLARWALLEDKSTAILDHVGDGVVVTDHVGVVSQWNRSATLITGHSAEQAVGRRCADVLGLSCDGVDLDCSRSCPLLSADLEPSPLGIEVSRDASDGRPQPLVVNVSAVRDRAGHVVEVVHSIRDITRLKQADEAKTIFLATASHELKTPLTVIGGFAETLLTRGVLGEAEREVALKAIHRRAVELGRIVDRLLLSSRIQFGSVDVKLTELDVVPLLTERVESFAASGARTIEQDFADRLPIVVADAEAFVTIIDHLIDNAFKYSPGGEPVVVRAHHDERGVTVSVSDNGIGMDHEAVEHCFDPFWQAESSDVRRFGGTGIGLYIVRALARAMGAEISVRSTPMRGSTFSLNLRLPGQDPKPEPADGERSSVREFMRQIGVPQERAS